MGVRGHDAVVEALTAEFPAVSILRGPRSVGKWTVAEQVRRSHGIVEPDVLRARSLTIPAVRAIADFVSRAPARPQGRVVIARLDGASPAALNVLLKPLEEAGPDVHFLLTSAVSPPVTLLSRAHVFDLGLLPPAVVSEILREERGIQPAQAKRLGELSGGQVRQALRALVMADEKSLVLSCLRALREKNPEALEGLALRWRDEHTAMLGTWAQEAVSGRWRLFNEAETGEVGTLPLRVLLALRRDSRPRLIIRSVLMDVLNEEN